MREFSQIVPVFDTNLDYTNSLLYKNVMCNTLQKILPKSFEKSDLPLVASHPNVVYCDQLPCQLSFYAVCQCQPHTFKFFLEMITRWLVPGKQLNVVLMYTADFRLSEEDPEIYSICEVKVKIGDMRDLEMIQRNLPIIEAEVRLGMGSSYYARRILELKGLVPEEKTAVIQEKIAHYLKRFPDIFQSDLLNEMSQVLVLCSEEFKAARISRHLCKIIVHHYLFRKEKGVVKLFPSKLYGSHGRKTVLSVVAAGNYFEENHIQSYFPNARLVEGSYFVNNHGPEKMATIYFEIEKNDGSHFSKEERQLLQKELSNAFREQEPMLHPVFMPCNEEEIMRNILSLSHQLKFLRDLPQVFISFDQQSQSDLYFTVIAVRILKQDSVPIQEMFQESAMEYIPDRIKRVGLLRKKYVKEATVFRISLPKARFVRKDHSIDLQKARQCVVAELTSHLGEIRDYNGGMISKQTELLSKVKQTLTEHADDLLLENFFYSLTPVVMRSLLDPQLLKTLFMMQLESDSTLNIKVEPEQVFVMVATEEKSVIDQLLLTLKNHSNGVAFSRVKMNGIIYLGIIYRNDDPEKQREFCQLIYKKCPISESASVA